MESWNLREMCIFLFDRTCHRYSLDKYLSDIFSSEYGCYFNFHEGKRRALSTHGTCRRDILGFCAFHEFPLLGVPRSVPSAGVSWRPVNHLGRIAKFPSSISRLLFDGDTCRRRLHKTALDADERARSRVQVWCNEFMQVAWLRWESKSRYLHCQSCRGPCWTVLMRNARTSGDASRRVASRCGKRAWAGWFVRGERTKITRRRGRANEPDVPAFLRDLAVSSTLDNIRGHSVGLPGVIYRGTIAVQVPFPRYWWHLLKLFAWFMRDYSRTLLVICPGHSSRVSPSRDFIRIVDNPPFNRRDVIRKSDRLAFPY